MENTIGKTAIDHEWFELIKEAKITGLTIEEIRLFLNNGLNTAGDVQNE
ncbi:anti-repressor SinI family protein [Virgibacillus ainsalahensis]